MKKIRLATLEDAQYLLDIYAYYVEETAISFEYEVPSLDEFKNRIKEYGGFYPYLVCEIDGKIVGYAYAHKYAQRMAYAWGAELSVYVDKDNLRGGIGKALYGALMDMLRLQNVYTAYGCITWPNERSVGLHKAMGFSNIGIFSRAGFKMGKWRDVLWMEKELLAKDIAPRALVGINEVSKVEIEKICIRNADFIK